MLVGRISLHVLLGGAAIVGVGGAAMKMLEEHSAYSNSWYTLLVFWPILFGLLVGIANFLHRKPLRIGGLYLAWGIILLLAISILKNKESGDINKWMSSFMVLLLFGMPAGGALLMRKKPWGAAFAWTFMSIASLSGAAMLFQIWYGAENYSSMRVYASAMITLVYGFFGSLCLINVGRGDWRLFRWPAVAAAAAAIVLTDYAIMTGDSPSNETLAKHLYYVSRLLAAFAGTMGLINVLLMTKRSGLTAWCKWAAIAAVSALGAIVAFAFLADYMTTINKWSHANVPWEWIERGIMAAMMLAMSGMICTLIARAALRITQVPTSPNGISAVDLTCPHCKTAGAISLKQGACKNCRLKFRITLVEPTCPRCEYLLFHVAGDKCPECGLAIGSGGRVLQPD